MDNLILYDYTALEIPEPLSCFNTVDKKWVDPKVDTTLKAFTGPKLRISISATYSGVLINKRVYPGVAVRRAAPTWVDNYGKPVLPEHPLPPTAFHAGTDPKPIGRVTRQKFIPFVSKDKLLVDYKTPEPYGSKGSGTILLDCQIAGHDNIEMVLDRRLTTTSAGHLPGALVCSICGKDWVPDLTPCGHKPGRVYEVELGDSNKIVKMECYLIDPPKLYDHIAFVNKPAAALSGVESISGLIDAMALETSVADSLPVSTVSEFIITDAKSHELVFYGEDRTLNTEPKAVSFVSLSSNNLEGNNTMAEEKKFGSLLDVLADRMAVYIRMSKDDPANYENHKNASVSKMFEDDKPSDEDITSMASQILGFVSKDSEEEGAELQLLDGLEETDLWDADTNVYDAGEVDNLIHEFLYAYKFLPDEAYVEDADKKKPQDKPGGSNVGKYSKSDGPFCGPKGGAPAGSFPIGTLKRAKAALAYAKNAPNPGGIKKCVCDKWGSQLPSCQASSKKKDEVEQPEGWEWAEFGIDKDYTSLPEPNEEGFVVEGMGHDEALDAIQLAELSDLPHPKAVPGTVERRKMDDSDFAGPNRTFFAATVEQCENSLFQLDAVKDKTDSELVARIQKNLNRKLELLGAKPEEEDSTDSSEEASAKEDANDKGDETQETVVETLAARIKSLEQKLGNTQDAMKEQTEENSRLRDMLRAEKRLNREILVDRLVDLKLALGKPEVVSVASEDSIKEFRDKLTSRKVDSLIDSISDLRLELLGKESSGVQEAMKDGELDDDSVKQGTETKPVEKPTSPKAEAKEKLGGSN